MLVTGVSLIIIISLIIVTIHTTLADDQPMPFNKYCELNLSAIDTNGNLGGTIEVKNVSSEKMLVCV